MGRQYLDGLIAKNSHHLEKEIKLVYEGETYRTIRDLQDQVKHTKIKYDFDSFPNGVPDDHHPSLKCHRLLADLIIESIEKDLQK